MLKCRICNVTIDQLEADLAWEIVGSGHETMCCECAEMIMQVATEAVQTMEMEEHE